MALREKLIKINTEQLADLSEIMDDADKLEADLVTANATIGERDKKIAELQEQANRLYAKLILSETGVSDEEEEKEETLEEFNEKMKEKMLERFN